MSQFTFLQSEWGAVFEAASKAESSVRSDPRASCFYARRALELAVSWTFKHDNALKLPYQDNLSALIHEPSFKQAAGEAVFSKARLINTLGNRAVHDHRPVTDSDALVAVRELFHFAYWFARTYARGERPHSRLAFDPTLLPRLERTTGHSAEELRALQSRLRESDEKIVALLSDKTSLDEELRLLREEVAKAKEAAFKEPDTHNYSEGETRDYFIDLLLKEAGWPLEQPRDREFQVSGMPNKKDTGFIDYVLWGDDGKPLGLVEAKRTRRDPRAGQHQAKLYADCIEEQFGRRPVIYYSNGYEHWLWDDTLYPPRRVQGFHKKAELELMIQRRQTRLSLAEGVINPAIVERHYQTRAIRRIAEAFERDNDRKALLVMATGAGKTRTVIALCDLLIRCNWAKRVLFLADRVALVNQAANAFKKFLPDSSPVNLVSESTGQGRIYVSTYQTMIGLIDDAANGERRFGIGHFDLVIVDEAHRSVFQKYRAIFNYFDSLLVGLTATPKDEVDRNTYSLFDLENGVPTDSYSLDEAVRDGFLVPPRAVSVPLKFQRDGIKYDELSDDDKDQWDSLEWDGEGNVPDRVEPEAVNRWLFNKDTVDKVLEHLMTRGLKVKSGDRLGKTIIFAKNQHHAEFIAERFDANYPHLKGAYARIVTFKTDYVQNLIDDFSNRDKFPHVAISVDMLDTGIDVPEVVNLVFFKLVRSKIKFWQMLGRGTRLSPELFGPGHDKAFFYLFDYCQNLEYFSQDITTTDGYAATSLAKRLFDARLELIAAIDGGPQADLGMAVKEAMAPYGDPRTNIEVRRAVVALLQQEVAAMNLENFIVRPHRRHVEKFAQPEAWVALAAEALAQLSNEISGLPTELSPESEEAKQFDLITLKLQLSLLRGDAGFERIVERVKNIVGLLAEKDTIPVVREQMPIIHDILTDAWWLDVTVPILETMRRRLRGLVHLIDKRQRRSVFTDFEDFLAGETEFTLPGFAVGTDQSKFAAKARLFLQQHLDHVAVVKLRTNRQLTSSDLSELERLLGQSGAGDQDDIRRAVEDAEGLGLLVRSLVGMDRAAAKEAMGRFTMGKRLTANQIEFVNLIVDHLTAHGVVEPARLYESPFTDVTPQGPDALFKGKEMDELLRTLLNLRETAAAA